MSPTAKTIFYYSFYMLAMGLGLLLIPNTLLGLFGFPPAREVWVRMLGLLAFCAGILYFYCARTNQTGFFRISVPERMLFFLGTLGIVLFLPADPVLALIGGVDLAGALWTWWTLRPLPASPKPGG
jgi:hypothetical protein